MPETQPNQATRAAYPIAMNVAKGGRATFGGAEVAHEGATHQPGSAHQAGAQQQGDAKERLGDRQVIHDGWLGPGPCQNPG